jgi:cytoskeletal protein CcmA (bactofilin family)
MGVEARGQLIFRRRRIMSADKKKRRRSDVDYTSFIAEGTEIHGAYGGKTDLFIAGVLHGDVDVQGTVLVADAAVVHGSVSAVTVVIGGRVEGNVRAKKAAEIRPKAVIGGAVTAKEVFIAVGAKIGGEIRANGGKPPMEFKEQRRPARAHDAKK